MLSLYLDQPTWLHRVSAWIKLATLSAVGMALFVFDSLAVALAAALAALALCASLGPAGWRAIRLLRGLSVVLALIVLFHFLADDWRVGVAAALRLATLTGLGVMLSLSTRFDDLLAVGETLLRPLRRLGLSSQRLALSFGLMLRFIESFFLQWRRLDDAHRARSGRPGGFRLLAPLALHTLATAERVGDALSARLGR
jgi:biotin transport system permease protein